MIDGINTRPSLIDHPYLRQLCFVNLTSVNFAGEGVGGEVDGSGGGDFDVGRLSSTPPGMNNYFTEMCSGSEAGSYVRLIDFYITQL